MRVEANNNGVTFIREAGDKRIGKESTVVYHMRDGLRTDTRKAWKRFNPSNVGLTSCKLGVHNPNQGIAVYQ